MQATYLLTVLVLVLGIADYQVTALFEKCKRTYRKVGCFDVGATELLVNDRAPGALHQVEWGTIVPYLHSLACRCARKARNEGFSHFGFRFYGECYGLMKEDLKDATKSTDSFQTQDYTVCDDDNEEECGGVEDEYVYELLPLKMNGGYGEWEPYGECSKPCGGGTQNRTRECDKPSPKNGGNDCSTLGPAVEIQECNKHDCADVFSTDKAVDGGYGKWGAFSKCSKTCGWGKKTRTRECNNPEPANGGKKCKGPAKRTRRCRIKRCKGKKVKIYRRVICKGKKSTIKCGKGEKIKVRFANYGRLNKKKCKKGAKHKFCRNPESTKKVTDLCGGKESCSLEANDSVFGKKCDAVNSYLKVSWICVK